MHLTHNNSSKLRVNCITAATTLILTLFRRRCSKDRTGLELLAMHLGQPANSKWLTCSTTRAKIAAARTERPLRRRKVVREWPQIQLDRALAVQTVVKPCRSTSFPAIRSSQSYRVFSLTRASAVDPTSTSSTNSTQIKRESCPL